MNRLRVAILALLVFSGILPGQSVIPQAVNETINLAPRAKKGDLQQYLLTFEVSRPDANGIVDRVTTDYLAYSQVCQSNTPERGIEYMLTVDSFTIGTSRKPGEPERDLKTAYQFDGYVIRWLIDRQLRAQGDCFDTEVRLRDDQLFVEGSELLIHLSYIRLWEEARFLLGNELKKIGDSASLSLPAPLCYDVPGVIKQHHVKLARQVFELSGITQFRGRACAVVKVHPSQSIVDADLANLPGASMPAKGSLSLGGELLISLDKGQILQAAWSTRTQVLVEKPDGSAARSDARDVYLLRQLN